MSRSNRLIIGGVDTHAATHHAAVIDLHGRLLADAQFPATPRGYASLLTWMRGKGRVDRVGIEAPRPSPPARRGCCDAAGASRLPPSPRRPRPRRPHRRRPRSNQTVSLEPSGVDRAKPPQASDRRGAVHLRVSYESINNRPTLAERRSSDRDDPEGRPLRAQRLSGLSAETVQATCPTAVPMA